MNKKYIHALFFTLVLILSACGSNEKEDGTTSIIGASSVSGSIDTSIKNFKTDTSNGNFSTEITLSSAYANSVVSKLNSIDVVLNSCPLVAGSLSVTPSSVQLDGVNSSKNILVKGTLKDPNCKPTSYQVKGTNTLEKDGKTTTEPFATKVVNIPSALLENEDVVNLKLEVLDKRVDINESDVNKSIRLRITQGIIGSKGKEVKITSTITPGKFLATSATSDDAGDVEFIYTAPSTMEDKEMSVKFCLVEDSTICDTAKIFLSTTAIVPPVEVIDDINYFITFVPQGGGYNLSLNARNNAIVTLIDKDTKAPIANSSIESITVTSKDPSVLKLTPEGGGTPISSISYPYGRNAVLTLMTADKVNSGLAPVEVVVKYKNKNGKIQTRGQLFSIAVISGEATAFSINSAGVAYNAATKQFEHKFIVQATDASSNPISSTGVINVSAMASFAKDSAGREILYGRLSEYRGLPKVTVDLTPEGDSARLTLGGISPLNTSTIKEHRAFVAVFGGVDTYEANGKWNINKGSMSGNTLLLSNNYAGGAYSGLGMAVGYNFRDKFCTSAYQEAVIVIDSTDGTYKLDEKGQAVVTIKHDAYMIGKRVMLMVNMTGLNPQTGEVKRSGEVLPVTLSHIEGLDGYSFSIPKGVTNYRIIHKGTILAGSDKHTLYNSTFGCGVKTSGGITGIALVGQNDPSSCDNGGAAYLAYDVNTSGEAGTVNLSDCQVNNEPAF
ncbi:MAG: hypothetical protein L3J43_09385 [Sulfurovum sp.]|nr:hypothetical protein [Sulfurovum sp.]